MEKGKVKWYNETKGFGFIEISEGNDVFVHRTSLVSQHDGLQEGDEVEFDVERGEKGLAAVNVKVV